MRNLVTLLVLLLCTFECVFSRTRISISGGGYKDVVIGIEDNVVPANQDEFIDQIKSLFDDASSKLHAATNQRVFFDTITISVPSSWSVYNDDDTQSAVPFESSDIRVVESDGKGHGDNPWTSHSGLCGSQGEYVSVTRNFIEGDSGFLASFGDRGKALVHEWAHFRWGVFEEYGFPGDQRFPYFYFPPGEKEQIATYSADATLAGAYKTVDGSSCMPNENGAFATECRFFPDEDNTATVSMMSYHFLKSATSLDDSVYHKKEVPSKHNQLCNHESVWSVMTKNKVDFPTGNSVTYRPPTYKVVRRLSEPVVFILFDTGKGTTTTPYANIDEIKSHLKNVVSNFVGRHVGLATYAGNGNNEGTDVINTHFPIKKLTTVEQLTSIIDSVTQTSDTVSTFSFPVDKALRTISAYGAPVGAVLYVIGYSGVDTLLKYMESHVISFALRNRVKVLGQESFAGRSGYTSNLLRITALTNGNVKVTPGSFTSTDLNANFESLRDEFSSVSLTATTVLSTVGQARASSPASFKFSLPASVIGDVKVFVTGKRTGAGNIETCSLSVKAPTGTEVTGSKAANWEASPSPTNRLYLATTEAVAGEWTVRFSCTSAESLLPYFWIDIFSNLAATQPFEVSSWLGSTNGNARLYARISQGNNKVTGAQVIGHMRVEVPSPNSALKFLDEHFNFTLTDDGFGDPDVATDGIYSGIILPPATITTGNYRIGIEVKAAQGRGIARAGEGSIPLDQGNICCGSSDGSVGVPIPTDFHGYFPDLVSISVQQQLTNVYKPPKLSITNVAIEAIQREGNVKVTMKWIAPPGSATNPATPVTGYDVNYSGDITSINTAVQTFDSCTPTIPGTEQTCSFTVNDFTSQTIFVQAAAKVGTQTGDRSPIAWSQPLDTTQEPTTGTTPSTTVTGVTTGTADATTVTMSSATSTVTEVTTSTSSVTTTGATTPSDITNTASTSDGTTATISATVTSTTETSTATGTTGSGSTATTSTSTPTSVATDTTSTTSSSTTVTGTATTSTASAETTATTTVTPTGTATTTAGSTSSSTTAKSSTTTEEITTNLMTTETTTGSGTTTERTTETGATTETTTTGTTTTERTTTGAFTTTTAELTSTTQKTTTTMIPETTGTEDVRTTTDATTGTAGNSTMTDSGTTGATSTGETTPAPPPTNPPCDGGYPTCEPWFLPVVIAVPVGGVVLIAVITAVTCYCRKKGKKSSFDNDQIPLTENRPSPPTTRSAPPPQPKAKQEPPITRRIEEPRQQVAYTSETQVTKRPVSTLSGLSLNETKEDEDMTLTAL